MQLAIPGSVLISNAWQAILQPASCRKRSLGLFLRTRLSLGRRLVEVVNEDDAIAGFARAKALQRIVYIRHWKIFHDGCYRVTGAEFKHVINCGWAACRRAGHRFLAQDQPERGHFERLENGTTLWKLPLGARVSRKADTSRGALIVEMMRSRLLPSFFKAASFLVLCT